MIDFRWSDVKGENKEDIAKAKLIESLQKQADKEIFQQQKKLLEDYLIITVSFPKRRKNILGRSISK